MNQLRRAEDLRNGPHRRACSRRGPNTRVLLFALFILLHIPSSGRGQEGDADKRDSSGIKAGIETAFNSRYVHRGLAFSQGPVNQSTAGLTLYASGNFTLDREAGQQAFSEIDFGVSSAHAWKKLVLEPSVEGYLYRPSAPANAPPTSEASIKLSHPIGPAGVFARQAVDIGSYRGAYFGETALTYEASFDRQTSVAAALTFGWASARFNEAYAGVPKRAFNVIDTELSLTYAPTDRFYVRPHLEFTYVCDGQLRRQLDSAMLGTLGLTVGFNSNAAPSR